VTPERPHVSDLTASMTDADLQEMLRRALRTVIILSSILVVVMTAARGWQTGLLFLAGAAISYTGIREWRSLALAVFDRIDNQQNARPMGRTLVMFFLRLGMVAVVLYVSLRCLHGSIYALVAGLALAVVALSFEALRLLRA
jgi:hypothetical protein